jgi:hypothetical protein
MPQSGWRLLIDYPSFSDPKKMVFIQRLADPSIVVSAEKMHNYRAWQRGLGNRHASSAPTPPVFPGLATWRALNHFLLGEEQAHV